MIFPERIFNAIYLVILVCSQNGILIYKVVILIVRQRLRGANAELSPFPDGVLFYVDVVVFRADIFFIFVPIIAKIINVRYCQRIGGRRVVHIVIENERGIPLLMAVLIVLRIRYVETDLGGDQIVAVNINFYRHVKRIPSQIFRTLRSHSMTEIIVDLTRQSIRVLGSERKIFPDLFKQGFQIPELDHGRFIVIKRRIRRFFFHRHCVVDGGKIVVLHFFGKQLCNGQSGEHSQCVARSIKVNRHFFRGSPAVFQTTFHAVKGKLHLFIVGRRQFYATAARGNSK